MEVRRAPGIGLLESAPEQRLCQQLMLRRSVYERPSRSRLNTRGSNSIVVIEWISW
jgi:hypothetical protein